MEQVLRRDGYERKLFRGHCSSVLFPFRPFCCREENRSVRSIIITFLHRSFIRGQTGWTFQQLERFPEDLCLHRPPANDGKDQSVTVVVTSAWSLPSLNRRRRTF